ncbi:MAG: tetratricopeptide repeat protein [Candidatus Cloacimonetes bacterium]|nr:tetratricopeptide repeat protein [Candidatus Cloacimonadota bacterium]
MSKLKKKKQEKTLISKTDRIITCCILGIWGFILVFAIVSQINPVWLQDLSQTGRKTEAEKGKQEGDRLLRQNQPAKALAFYKAALEISKDHTEILGNMAIAYKKIDDTNSAEKILKRLLRIDKERPHLAAFNLGQIYASKENWALAINYFEKGLETDPFKFASRISLAIIYLKTNRLEEAEKLYRQALHERSDFYTHFKTYIHKEHIRYGDKLEDYPDIDTLYYNLPSPERITAFDRNIFMKELRDNDSIEKNWSDWIRLLLSQQRGEEALTAMDEAILIWPKLKARRQGLLEAITP